jgi:predicted CXXCH cytochrome family protein
VYAASRSAARNHPVGLPYERATAYGGYVAAAVLPPEVRLFDGRVSCLTCHRSYSARHGATVLPTAGSRLCFACHDL